MANLLSDDMQLNKKKITMSKIQLVITGTLFVISVLFVAIMYLLGKVSDSIDTAALVAILAVTGTIFGSNLCWYSKKSASENHYKLRMSLYSDCAKVRLQYNEAMMQLIKKYGMSESDIEKIDETGDLDDMMDSTLSSVVEDLDETRNDADSKNEIEQVSTSV